MNPFGVASPRLLRNQRAFTLLEVLVALFIFAIVLSTLYAAYIGTFKNIEETESQADIYEMARIALERMVEDLESVYMPQSQSEEASEEKEETSSQIQFEGTIAEVNGRRADSLRFISRAHLVFDEDEKRAGTAEVAYYVTEGNEEEEEEEGLTLYRSDTPSFEQSQASGTGGWVLCDRLYSVQFSYHDNEGDSHDSWEATGEDDENRLPSAVSILLEFINPADPESPIKFMTRVALPMAGKEDE